MKIQDLLGKNKKDRKKKTAKKVAIGTGVGTAIGMALGVLFAPKSGKETREQISKNAKDAVESVKDTYIEVKGKVTDKVSELTATKEEKCCCGEQTCEENKTEQ